MPVVGGGSKLKVIATSGVTDTDGVGFGKHVWLAQTFTLDEAYRTFRYQCKKCSDLTDDWFRYALRYTNPDGSPWANDIAQTTSTPLGYFNYCPGKWTYFDMPGFPEIGPGLFALVIAAPGSNVTTANKLRCSEYPDIYASGKAWLSEDEGFTWERVPNKTFLFAAWGYQPPPEPPPPPVLSNWAVLKLEQIQLSDGYTIIATTNIPCHLYLRWTNIHPEQHKIPRYRRGIYLFDDKRFCFVAWHENEQAEEGDTLVHTFTKRNWPVCETRWFYLVGTKQAEQQPSTSPIFTKHFAGVDYYCIFREIWTAPPPPPGPPDYSWLLTEPWSS